MKPLQTHILISQGIKISTANDRVMNDYVFCTFFSLVYITENRKNV